MLGLSFSNYENTRWLWHNSARSTDGFIYRNRSGCTLLDFSFPSLQPDYMALGMDYDFRYAVSDCYTITRAASFYNAVALNTSEEIIAALSVETNEQRERLLASFTPYFCDKAKYECAYGSTSKFKYLVVNMYGHTDTTDLLMAVLSERFNLAYIKDAESMLIQHANHKVSVLSDGYNTVVFTNTLTPKMFINLNAVIFKQRWNNNLIDHEQFSYIDPELYIHEILCVDILTAHIQNDIDYDVPIFKSYYETAKDNYINWQAEQAKHLVQYTPELEAELIRACKTHSGAFVTRVENLHTQMRGLLNRYNSLIEEKRRYELLASGFTNEENKMTEEFISFVKDMLANKESSLRSVIPIDSGGALFGEPGYRKNNATSMFLLAFTTPLLFWNEDYAKMLVENKGSVLYDAVDNTIVQLFKDLFIDKVATLYTYMYVRVELSTYTAQRYYPDDTYDTACNLRGIAQPHVMGYNCFGDNASLIMQALEQANFTQVVLQLQTLCSSINLADSIVVENALLLDLYNGRSKGKALTRDGKDYTIAEYIATYINS